MVHVTYKVWGFPLALQSLLFRKMLLCSDQVVASLRDWHLEGLKPKAKFWTLLCGLCSLQGLGFPVGAPKLAFLENGVLPLVSSRFAAGRAGSKAASGALGWSELLGRARALSLLSAIKLLVSNASASWQVWLILTIGHPKRLPLLTPHGLGLRGGVAHWQRSENFIFADD